MNEYRNLLIDCLDAMKTVVAAEQAAKASSTTQGVAEIRRKRLQDAMAKMKHVIEKVEARL